MPEQAQEALPENEKDTSESLDTPATEPAQEAIPEVEKEIEETVELSTAEPSQEKVQEPQREPQQPTIDTEELKEKEEEICE